MLQMQPQQGFECKILTKLKIAGLNFDTLYFILPALVMQNFHLFVVAFYKNNIAFVL